MVFNYNNWKSIVKNMPIGVCILDKEKRLIYVNDKIVDSFEYSIKELDGKNIFDFISEEDKSEMVKLIMGQKIKSVNIKFITKSGKILYFTVYNNLIVYRRNKYNFLFFIDITHNVEQSDLLEKFNIVLKNFAHMTAHDLKSPLISLNSLSSKLSNEVNSLCEDNKTPNNKARRDKIRKLLLMIQDSTELMRDTVDRSLKYAETENVEYSEFHLNLAVNSAKKNLKAKRRELSKKVTYNIGNLPIVYADIEKLVLIFQNLFSNAMKFNDKDQVIIDVWGEDRGDNWAVYVKDNGMGIKEKDLPKIFTLYKRFHGSKIEGSGVGLSIVERIVKSHNGDIFVDSVFGKHTIFMFSLPKNKK